MNASKNQGLKSKIFVNFSSGFPKAAAPTKNVANFSLIKKSHSKKIESLEKTMAMLEFKCWYYDKALQDGNEDELRQMLPDNLPEEIQKIYDKAHE